MSIKDRNKMHAIIQKAIDKSHGDPEKLYKLMGTLAGFYAQAACYTKMHVPELNLDKKQIKELVDAIVDAVVEEQVL